MPQELSAKHATEITELLADLSQDDVRFTSTYSGRAMYGRTCVGWTGSFNPALLGFAIASVMVTDYGDMEDAADLLRSVAQDSMGLSTIVYLTDVVCPEWDDEADDDDDY